MTTVTDFATYFVPFERKFDTIQHVDQTISNKTFHVPFLGQSPSRCLAILQFKPLLHHVVRSVPQQLNVLGHLRPQTHHQHYHRSLQYLQSSDRDSTAVHELNVHQHQHDCPNQQPHLHRRPQINRYSDIFKHGTIQSNVRMYH